MNYYQINDDFYTFPNQLFITEIKGFSNPTSKKTPSELLKEGHTSWVHQTIVKSGYMEVDYTESFFGYCIVSQKVKDLIEANQILDVDFIPLELDIKTTQPYYCMLDLLRFDCVDEVHSEFTRFVENDPVRPDRAGEYSGFFKLIILKLKYEVQQKNR